MERIRRAAGMMGCLAQQNGAGPSAAARRVDSVPCWMPRPSRLAADGSPTSAKPNARPSDSEMWPRSAAAEPTAAPPLCGSRPIHLRYIVTRIVTPMPVWGQKLAIHRERGMQAEPCPAV